MPTDNFDSALAKLETMGGRHSSMVLFSEAKALYKLVPTLQGLLSRVDLRDDADILELARIIAEEEN